MTILETKDGGKTWGAVSAPTNKNLLGLYMADGGKVVVAVGDEGTILRFH